MFCAPFDCIFTNFDVVEPDLLVVLGNQSDILTEQNVRGAPAIVVEILSPGTSRRDRGIKRNLYDRGGVREYWIIDSIREHIEIFARQDASRLRSTAAWSARERGTLCAPLLPDFSLGLVELFRAEP